MAETKEKDAKDAKDATEPKPYKIGLIGGHFLSVEIDDAMKIKGLEDFKSAPAIITGKLAKTGEPVLIRWEMITYIEAPTPKEKPRAGFGN